MIRLALNDFPWKSTGTSRQFLLVFMTDPGIWTSIVLGIMVGSNFPFVTKFSVTKEWDAPESNITLAGVKLTRNIPRTISGASAASSAETWFRWPLATLA
jgi:hypothetical protein